MQKQDAGPGSRWLCQRLPVTRLKAYHLSHCFSHRRKHRLKDQSDLYDDLWRETDDRADNKQRPRAPKYMEGSQLPWDIQSIAMQQRQDAEERMVRRAEQIRNERQRQATYQDHQSNSSTHWRQRSRLTGYDVVKDLRVGGLSESVQVVREQRSQKLRIIKCVSTHARPKAELEILKRIPKGHNLNYMVEFAWRPNGTEIAFVLEHCDGGDLYSLLADHAKAQRLFSEGFLWHVLQDVGSALAFLHGGITDPLRQVRSCRSWDTICHLDIKPENIFLSSHGSRDSRFPHLVLGDFGCAVTRHDVHSGREHMTRHRHGTPEWYPPESVEALVGSSNSAYGRPTDVWQLGAVVVCLAQLWEVPIKEMVMREAERPCGRSFGKEVNRVVDLCVRLDRHRRPSAQKIVRAAAARSSSGL